MSYAIVNVVYGTVLTAESDKWIRDNESLPTGIIDTLYSASGPPDPAYIGKIIGEFSEGDNSVKVFPGNPTVLTVLGSSTEIILSDYVPQHRKDDVLSKLSQLPEAFRNTLPPTGYYILWSSS